VSISAAANLRALHIVFEGESKGHVCCEYSSTEFPVLPVTEAPMSVPPPDRASTMNGRPDSKTDLLDQNLQLYFVLES
jgi:hypothetical protein